MVNLAISKYMGKFFILKLLLIKEHFFIQCPKIPLLKIIENKKRKNIYI